MSLKIALVQTDSLIGNISTNFSRIVEIITKLKNTLLVDLIVFPELMITGYPPEDLLFRRDYIDQSNNTLFELANIAPNIGIVIDFQSLAMENSITARRYYQKAVFWQSIANKNCQIMVFLMNNVILRRVKNRVFSSSKVNLLA